MAKGQLKTLYAKDFNPSQLTEKNRNEHILLVDGLNLFLNVFSAVPSMNDNGDHIGGVWGFIKSLAKSIRTFKPTRVVVVFDGEGGSKRRSKLYPEYKNKSKVKVNYNRYEEFKDLVDEKESMNMQVSKLLDYLDLLPITTIIVDDVEADDVIAYIRTSLSDNKVTIMSTDKDFLQLVDDRTEVYSLTKKRVYNPSILKEEYNLIPDNFLTYRLFLGDTSDNISGVIGVGAKTLLKLFPELKEQATSYEDILNQSRTQIEEGTKTKAYTKIVESEKILERNFILMQLREPDIPGSIRIKIKNIFDSDNNKLDILKFKINFLKDRIKMKNFDMWFRDSFFYLQNYK